MSKDLHDEIMNLPASGADDYDEYPNEKVAYKIGHRDARHAAANLVLAAAPQVVAYERGLPPLPEMASAADLAHVMQTPEDWDDDYRNTWQKLQVEAHNKRQWRKYALELRALAAAPVQAKEPGPEAAQQNGGLVRAALIDLMALERQATSACDGFKAQRDCNLRFARARKALADSADTAPVQPVAVPDVWISELVGGIADELSYGHGYRQGFNDCRAKVLTMNRAAPAAQGDAKDAELDRIKRLATCGTVDSFLLLPEQDKRYWFAMAWQESGLRKLAEERIAFLHSTNKDADGYEFGIAKVKFDASGKIESFLWGLGDNSDLDAAIAAKAAS